MWNKIVRVSSSHEFLLYCCFGGESVKIIISYSICLLTELNLTCNEQIMTANFSFVQKLSRIFKEEDWLREEQGTQKRCKFLCCFCSIVCWCWKELMLSKAFYVCIIHCFWMEQLANILSKSAIKGRPKSKGFLKKRNQVEQTDCPEIMQGEVEI